MCGIAGIFHLEVAKPVAESRLHAMADALAHRGPDGSGVWTAPGIGLAHRRLAVIDVSGSPQPMRSGDGRYAISFNGEIYNYAELRTELRKRGHVFETDGDTEVLLHAYREWGSAMLPRLNGMFAFALFDAMEQTVMLVRDRLGVKPLFYVPQADGSIAFASELKGLLALPGLRREPDLRAVEDYFALGYIPDDACLLAGFRKLPAGHVLILERGKPLPPARSWWDVDFSMRAKGSRADLIAELRHRLRDAVSSRMVADVPVGAFLSGGVDSATVVALMSELSAAPVETCTIGFEESALDESRRAADMAERFHTHHRQRIVRSDDFSAADRLAALFDEPFADASALPTLRVCELARETVTVALSGDGADEAFAGYRRYRFHAAESRVRGLLPDGLRRPVFGTLGSLYPKADWAPRWLRARTTLQALAYGEAEAYARSVGVLVPEFRAQLFSESFTKGLQGYRAEDRYITAMQQAPARTALDRAQYADMKIWLPGDILTKIDRTSMSVGLEAREPLLDHRLVEFAASLPSSLRLTGGQGKWILKQAMRDHLPYDVLTRPKMGFVTPLSAWFKGPLAQEASRLSSASVLLETGWFQPETIRKAAKDHQAGIADHGRLLWQLIMLEKAMTRLFG